MNKRLLLLAIVAAMPLSLLCYKPKTGTVHHKYVKPAIDNLHSALNLKPLTQDEKISIARYLMDYSQNPAARMPQLSEKSKEVVKRIITSYTDIKEKNPHSARNYLKRASSEIMFYNLFSPNKVHASRSTERKAMPQTVTKPKNSARSTTGLAGQLPKKSTAAKAAKPAPAKSVSSLQEKREKRKAAKKARKAREAAERRKEEMKERAKRKMALKSELWKLKM